MVSITPASPPKPQATSASQPAAASSAKQNQATSSAEDTNDTSTLSSLAQQLSASATLAQARDASLSPRELSAKATQLLEQITGVGYQGNRAKNDAEPPNSTDPDRLNRARQTTEFVNGKGSNPFSGLSHDQLSLITYDDSGTYTTNERRAAWEQAYDQREAWGKQVSAKIMDEYNATGKTTKSMMEVLDYYESLPAIEQASLPSGYLDKLRATIGQDQPPQSAQHAVAIALPPNAVEVNEGTSAT